MQHTSGKRCQCALHIHRHSMASALSSKAERGKRRGRKRRSGGLRRACASAGSNGKVPLHIGIVGFGTFGQFLGGRLAQHHVVSAWSRSDRSDAAANARVRWCSSLLDLCDAQPDVLIFSTSITSTESVLRSFPIDRLLPGTVFVDVLSVKEFPRRLFQSFLPESFDFVCTHPMFGPDSGAGSWHDLPLVYEMARTREGFGLHACRRLLETFEDEGCRMVDMDCAEHDRQAASSQFITHTVGRMLMNLDLPNTDINTKGYEALLNLVNNTANDSFELYYGLFLYNHSATEELDRLEAAFQQVSRSLRDKLVSDASSDALPKAVPPELYNEAISRRRWDASNTTESEDGNHQTDTVVSSQQ